MKTYLCVYFGSAVLALLATPIVARLARKLGWMDRPGVRKVHSSPIPRIGGLAILVAMLLMTLPVLALDNIVGEAFHKIQWRVITLLTASVCIFTIGLIDDVRSLSARVKLLSLVAAGVAICLTGARIQTIEVDGLFKLDLQWFSWPATILWIICVTVGMNFIDGLDGLAAGIAAIVCGVITLLAFYSGQIVMAVLMLALLGSLTGFLFFNFNPAKIFMGDCGSMFLGFMIGAGSVVCAAKTTALVGIALPALALGVPILDACFTIVRRGVLDRRSIFSAERGHIHHRLMAKGLNHRRTVLAIYAATLLAAGLGSCMLITRSVGTILVFGCVLVFLVLVFHFAGSARISETIAALHRNSAMSRQRRQERDYFEHAQLSVREATTLDGWWKAVCTMGASMEVDHLALSVDFGDGQGSNLFWHHEKADLQEPNLVYVSIPLGNHGGPTARMDVGVRANGSCETVCRRVMLIGRLIDERQPDLSSDMGVHRETLDTIADGVRLTPAKAVVRAEALAQAEAVQA